MPHLLGCDFVAQPFRATKLHLQPCMSHTATLLHKQELTNQRSPRFRDKVAQNRALLYSKKKLRDCLDVARHAMSQVRFCRATKLRDKIAVVTPV